MQAQVHKLVLKLTLLLLIFDGVRVQLQHLRACLINDLKVRLVGQFFWDLYLVDFRLKVLLREEIHEDYITWSQLSLSHEGKAKRVNDP